MTMCFRTLLAAGMLGFASCVSAAEPAPEADTQNDQADKGTDQQSTKKKGDRKGRDLDSCRRDARGLEGPERARFMTECLRSRA
jgi:hypothetical protein